MPMLTFSALLLRGPPLKSAKSSICLVRAAVMWFRDATHHLFHFQQSYLLAEGSCNDFDSMSCTCLYKKLVLVSNPVFFAPLWHSHSLNASWHTKLLELRTISAFSATTYCFDSLLSTFHLVTQKLGSRYLCFTAVNPSSWVHNCEPKPRSPLRHVLAVAAVPRTPNLIALLVCFSPLAPSSGTTSNCTNKHSHSQFANVCRC